jgi:heme A synthase
MVTTAHVRAAFSLVALTVFLMVFGSTVRVHGAGLSCPDWPLCFGVLVPELNFQVSLEWGHRVVAGFVSLGFFALGGWAWWRGVWAASARFRALWTLAALALATQVVLGGLTVLQLLAEWTVASHLVTGNTLGALLLALALTLRDLASESSTQVESSPVAAPSGASVALSRASASALAVLVPAQVILGGFVAGSHAGLVCGTWPSCNGGAWFPAFTGLLGLQVMHRITAYTLLAVALGNVFVQRGLSERARPAVVVAALVLLQAAIGVSNVLLAMPVEVTLAHSLGAALVYQSTTWMLYTAWTRGVAHAPVARPRDGASASSSPMAGPSGTSGVVVSA